MVTFAFARRAFISCCADAFMLQIRKKIIDKNVRPWLFTSYLVGWKGFFYIAIDADNVPIKGSMENWPAIRNSLLILLAHIGVLFGGAVYFFKRKDILT